MYIETRQQYWFVCIAYLSLQTTKKNSHSLFALDWSLSTEYRLHFQFLAHVKDLIYNITLLLGATDSLTKTAHFTRKETAKRNPKNELEIIYKIIFPLKSSENGSGMSYIFLNYKFGSVTSLIYQEPLFVPGTP